MSPRLVILSVVMVSVDLDALEYDLTCDAPCHQSTLLTPSFKPRIRKLNNISQQYYLQVSDNHYCNMIKLLSKSSSQNNREA